MSKLAEILKAHATAWAAQRANDEIGRGDLRDEADLDSGIHESPALSSRSTRKRSPEVGGPVVGRAGNDNDPLLDEEVTLIVYGWHNVQPGAMSWVFPSARQAISAAKTMRNATSWAIVRGQRPATELDAARASGSVMLEHTS